MMRFGTKVRIRTTGEPGKVWSLWWDEVLKKKILEVHMEDGDRRSFAEDELEEVK